MAYIAVGIGGIIGALLRYSLSLSMHAGWIGPFPAGTLTANWIGSFALGWFASRMARSETLPAWVRLGVGTGIIGSFTTFSTFSLEMVSLLQNGLQMYALLYGLLSLGGGLSMAWSGSRLANAGFKKQDRGMETP
jgi:CrcB protein